MGQHRKERDTKRRRHRHRHRVPITPTHVAAALEALGAVGAQGDLQSHGLIDWWVELCVCVVSDLKSSEDAAARPTTSAQSVEYAASPTKDSEPGTCLFTWERAAARSARKAKAFIVVGFGGVWWCLVVSCGASGRIVSDESRCSVAGGQLSIDRSIHRSRKPERGGGNQGSRASRGGRPRDCDDRRKGSCPCARVRLPTEANASDDSK